MYLRTAAIGFALLGAGCTTKDGMLSTGQPDRGLIIVRERNNLEARIFLDGRFTGKTTRDGRLDPAVGRHVVHLVLEKHRSVPESLEIELSASGAEVVLEMQPVPFGEIQVASQPGNAEVTLDGLVLGTTPKDPGQGLRLEGIPAGAHNLELVYGNYRAAQAVQVASGAVAAANPRLVLLQHAFVEDFTNVSCAGCPEVSRFVEDLIRSRQDFRIANNETHASFPSPNDPVYLGARAAQDNLQAYYKPPFLPAVFCNGVQLKFGMNYAQVVPMLDLALTRILATPGTLNLVLRSDGQGGGDVRVEAVGAPVAGAFLRVQVLQKELRFAVPPGTNNQTVFHNIIRGALEDAKGTVVSLAQGQSGVFPFRFDLSQYAREGLFLVAYLQDDATKAVLQANTIPL